MRRVSEAVSGALVNAKWNPGESFVTERGAAVRPVRHKTRWAITDRGTRHLIVQAVGVWHDGLVTYGAHWVCGEWGGQIQFLSNDVQDVYTCRRCALIDQYGLGWVVYRYHSPTGELLYVGSTGDLPARHVAHERATWFVDGAVLSVEEHDTKHAARTAESAAILREQPTHNKRGKRARHDR